MEVDMSVRRPRVLASFFGFASSGLLACGLIRGHIHADFWWMGLVLVILVANFYRYQISRPLALWREIGAARICLNREAQSSNERKLGRFTWPPFLLRPLVALVLLVVVFGQGLVQEGFFWVNVLAESVRPARLSVHVEPPSFASARAQAVSARPGEVVRLNLLSGSFMQMTLSGGRGFSAVSEVIFPEAQFFRSTSTRGPAMLEASSLSRENAFSPETFSSADQKAWLSPFSENRMWSGSTELITSALDLDAQAVQRLVIVVRTPSSGPFFIDATVEPVPRPEVSLEKRDPPPDQRSPSQTIEGALFFAAQVQSQVPLTTIELAVRTESGYSFNLPVGEFTGSERLDFISESVQLLTAGIPFGEADVLYVQARAHTVIPGLTGESQEFRFSVKSPRESREKLIEQLEAALDTLSDVQSGGVEMKQSLVNQLQEAQQTSRQLGNQSLASRQVREALRRAEALDPKNKQQRDEVESQIQDTLDALRRRNSRESASSWFLKTRNFLSRLAHVDVAAEPQALSHFSEKGAELSQEAQALKAQLEQLIESPQSGLTLDEKLLAMEMLENDETPVRMEGVTELIGRGERDEALEQGQETLTDATLNLGGLLQLISVARARVIREARDRLTKADAELENVRQSMEPGAQRSSARQAEKELRETPELGNQFNDALEEAQDSARQAGKALRRGNQGELVKSLDGAQRAIVRALAELQEEEQASREEQGDEDGRRYRSTMDAMNAQGQHDAGWRRRIFETISRLREQGVSADAAVIRYLESRLR